MLRVLLLLAASLLVPYAAVAEEVQYQEGKQYVRLAQPQPTASSEVEVLEFFRYGCPHCRDFDPYIRNWKKDLPETVQVTLVPAVMSRNSGLQARAFYAAQDLGVFDRVHAAMFEAIQVKRIPLGTEEQILALVQEIGIDRGKFLDAMNSFQVDTRVRNATQIIRNYRVSGVPAVAVNGRYLTGGGMGVGSYADLIKVIDHLVKLELDAKAKQK